jgi:hypothetical protein
MKNTLLKLIVAILVLAAPPILQAQSLLNAPAKTEDQKAVESVDVRRTRLINTIELELNQMYREINRPGKQQARLDLFGTNAAAALQEYAEMRAWVIARKPTANIPVADPSVFVVSPQGTVTYVAPPEPEKPTTPDPRPSR